MCVLIISNYLHAAPGGAEGCSFDEHERYILRLTPEMLDNDLYTSTTLLVGSDSEDANIQHGSDFTDEQIQVLQKTLGDWISQYQQALDSMSARNTERHCFSLCNSAEKSIRQALELLRSYLYRYNFPYQETFFTFSSENTLLSFANYEISPLAGSYPKTLALEPPGT